MASFYKSQGQSLISGVDTVELERALHNLEFEKKQQIQEFEKEKQQIAILEKSTNEKQDGIKRMEEDVSRIDEEIKSSHRQFRQNKELLKESQKAHSSVLNFHLEAKKKEIQQLTEKYEIENADLQSKLDHYDTVWKSYEEVYMQQENAKELMKWQLEVLQCKEAVKEGRLQISNLQQGEDELQEEILANESPFQSITDFVIKFAEIKVSTQVKQFETEQLLNSISAAEKDIQTLQETQAEIVKNIEEKRKEEELEKQRIEKKKEQKEKALQEEYAR
ncbi:golgin subfamily A member 6-like protein 7 [Lytechinus variegatus]|uniref:golgin subfamily A member 6-like protein 7 n=1 Tax=Lytechinus variegatus TaxID=7654 RepID=UPI001BB16927|nr:golgin subfamily A member 6-like protein 7 [Lytechinus variegatus]